jgi:hypothetical protein
MKTRNSQPWPSGLARFLRCIFFVLVPALASDATPGQRAPPPSTLPDSEESSPYLPLVGPPPLRFAQAPPPPDLSTRPTPAAPPRPTVMEEIAATNAASAKSNTPASGAAGMASDQHRSAAVEGAPVVPEMAARPSPGKETPALLPDDVQHETRPEEILPFFQFPGSGGATVVVPGVPTAPETTRLPVSSAVYRQH